MKISSSKNSSTSLIVNNYCLCSLLFPCLCMSNPMSLEKAVSPISLSAQDLIIYYSNKVLQNTYFLTAFSSPGLIGTEVEARRFSFGKSSYISRSLCFTFHFKWQTKKRCIASVALSYMTEVAVLGIYSSLLITFVACIMALPNAQ